MWTPAALIFTSVLLSFCCAPQAASSTKLEIQLGETLHFLQFDLADDYYQIEYLMALRECFSWPLVEKHEQKGCQLTTRLSCRWWTHALAFCQTILSRVAALLSPVLQDNLPAPRLDPRVLSVHVDNFAAIGTNVAHVRDFWEQRSERSPRSRPEDT